MTDDDVVESDVEHDPDEKLEPEGAGRAESVAMDDDLKSDILDTNDDDSDDADESEGDGEPSAAEEVKEQADSDAERARLDAFEEGLKDEVDEQTDEAGDVEGDGDAVEVDMNILLDDEIIGSLVAAPFEMADGMIGEPDGDPEMALSPDERDRLAMMIEAVADDEGWEMSAKTGLILTFLQVVAVRMNRWRSYRAEQRDDEIEDDDGDRDLDELRDSTEQGERVDDDDSTDDDEDSDSEGDT